ncbi:hypothetical protein MED01_002341 [Micromonospora sp. MED01]|uniref:hypothetical protein n=1 Tax=Micromonospora alfalfae TaxID=2911212 RepID=UPI001EE8FC84|nr:hypothetical protein [Micromonospora alfalfae]MCG5464176.1 hypothetical protein [Micromonospora alfalfae]
MTGRVILRTDTVAQHPWPDDTFLQGGSRGVVFASDGNYRTAFVEAFHSNPDTFLRGEGTTVAEAEDACWAKYQTLTACPAHPEHGPFEARQYTNGAGFCAHCGTWFSKVLPGQPEDPDRAPSLMERVFTGDGEALVEVLTAAADVDDLPTRGGGV